MPLIKQNLNFIFGLLLSILLTACGSENEAKDSANSSDPQPARVALVMKSLANEYFINMMEEALGKKAIKNFLPIEKGDVEITYADTNKLEEWIDFRPKINIKEGINNFVRWYIEYYKNL